MASCMFMTIYVYASDTKTAPEEIFDGFCVPDPVAMFITVFSWFLIAKAVTKHGQHGISTPTSSLMLEGSTPLWPEFMDYMESSSQTEAWPDTYKLLQKLTAELGGPERKAPML